MKDDAKIWIPVIAGMMGIVYAHYFWYDLNPSKTMDAIGFGTLLFTITLLVIVVIEYVYVNFKRYYQNYSISKT